jgi:hypothetical protein
MNEYEYRSYAYSYEFDEHKLMSGRAKYWGGGVGLGKKGKAGKGGKRRKKWDETPTKFFFPTVWYKWTLLSAMFFFFFINFTVLYYYLFLL